jgi:hypothetical protein
VKVRIGIGAEKEWPWKRRSSPASGVMWSASVLESGNAVAMPAVTPWATLRRGDRRRCGGDRGQRQHRGSSRLDVEDRARSLTAAAWSASVVEDGLTSQRVGGVPARGRRRDGVAAARGGDAETGLPAALRHGGARPCASKRRVARAVGTMISRAVVGLARTASRRLQSSRTARQWRARTEAAASVGEDGDRRSGGLAGDTEGAPDQHGRRRVAAWRGTPTVSRLEAVAAAVWEVREKRRLPRRFIHAGPRARSGWDSSWASVPTMGRVAAIGRCGRRGGQVGVGQEASGARGFYFGWRRRWDEERLGAWPP